jgi:hypothetical protein
VPGNRLTTRAELDLEPGPEPVKDNLQDLALHIGILVKHDLAVLLRVAEVAVHLRVVLNLTTYDAFLGSILGATMGSSDDSPYCRVSAYVSVDLRNFVALTLLTGANSHLLPVTNFLVESIPAKFYFTALGK